MKNALDAQAGAKNVEIITVLAHSTSRDIIKVIFILYFL